MALVTRYFSPNGAGTQDGTSMANAAPLFTGGAWSTVITGFNFGGTDSLECRLVGSISGTQQLYTISVGLTTASFTVAAPTKTNPLFLYGCDSLGNLLTPPYGWTSDQPAWDGSSLPLISPSTNIQISNFNIFYRMVAFSSSVNTTNPIVRAGLFDWCQVTLSGSSTSADPADQVLDARNSVFTCSGSQYSCVIGGASSLNAENCRVSGVAGTGGARSGINVSGSNIAPNIVRCTVLAPGGVAIYLNPSALTTGNIMPTVQGNVVVGAGSDGVYFGSAGSQPAGIIEGNVIVGCGGYGVNAAIGTLRLRNNRFRNNASGDTNGLGNIPDYDSYTTAATDADDFADAASGDYRVKSTAGFANRGIGVSQMSSGGSSSTNSIFQPRIFAGRR